MSSTYLAAVAERRADVLLSDDGAARTVATTVHEATILAWIRAGKDVNNHIDSAGATPHLWLASRDGDLSVVALLVRAGAALNQPKAASGITPLYIAAFSGNDSVVALLLHARTDTSLAKSNGVGPLHIASSKGHTEIVKMLLRAGAATEQRADDGSTPLHAACGRCQSGAVAALIDARAFVDPVADNGSSPLLVAIHRDDRQTARLLLSAHASPDAANEYVVTPLYAACQRGYADLAAMLCAAKATVDPPPADRGDLAQRTADQLSGSCMGALNVACQEGHTETVSVLLAARADANRLSTGQTATPLVIACDNGHATIASLLIAAGAAVDLPDDDGETALFKSSCRGHVSTVATLLTEGAAVDTTNAAGATAMYVACYEGHLPCVQLLSAYGAKRTATIFGRYDTQRYDVFEEVRHVAWRAGHEDVATWLDASWLWCTPLHHLCVIDAARARELLRSGADINACGWSPACGWGGDTPLTIAIQIRNAVGSAIEGTAAALVLRAAERWSPATHELYPEAKRTRAVEVMLMCHRLSRKAVQDQGAQSGALFDALMDGVIPELIGSRLAL